MVVVLRRPDKELPLIGVVVGNKRDMDIRRQVQATAGEDWARGQGLEFCEVSAVSGVFVPYFLHLDHHSLAHSTIHQVHSPIRSTTHP
jgi:hypothetical protein